MNPGVAIVILNWNGRNYLQQFLPSVLASDYPSFSVIVADNGSTDDSISFVQEHFPAVRIIKLDQNYGFARGYNEALKQVNEEYIVLLNSDVEVSAGWIKPIIELMENDLSIAACQPKILMQKNPHYFEYAGACGGWLDQLGYPFARGRIFDVCEEDKGQYDAVAPIFWASGAAMFVRNKIYKQCGGLDEYFFAHQEEIDLCWRMQLAGYKIMACPQSVVYHVGGGTLPKGNERKVYLNFRNNLVMMAKNLPARAVWWKVPLRIGLDIVSAWKSLFSGEGIYFVSIAKAHIRFIQWVLAHRKKGIFPPDKKGILHGWYHGSIIWQHFVLKRTKFSEIVENKTV